MTVIPFPRRPEAEPLAFTIGARVDLRVGALAAGVVRPRGPADEAFSFSVLARLLRGARMAWRERGAFSGLALAVPAEIQSSLNADLLDAAAVEAGCTRPAFSFELDERQLVATGAALAEELRARGWNVALRADPDCPLPFGARAKPLFRAGDQSPDVADPFLAVDEDRTPLGRRILAAKAAGLLITASCVHSAAQARTLAIAGFDRGGGPYAESGFR